MYEVLVILQDDINIMINKCQFLKDSLISDYTFLSPPPQIQHLIGSYRSPRHLLYRLSYFERRYDDRWNFFLLSVWYLLFYWLREKKEKKRFCPGLVF
jgi:hypothetical protein